MPSIIIAHTRAKFNTGDPVVVNGRCPKWLLGLIRHNRKRTIVSVFYDADRRCCSYYLGINNMGASDDIDCYPFRSYQLHKPIKRGVGRPRQKRKYNRKVSVECTVASPNKNLGVLSANQYNGTRIV